MENVIDFVTKFAADFEKPVNEDAEEEEEEEDGDENEFLNFLFNFLLEVVSHINVFSLRKNILKSISHHSAHFLSLSSFFPPSVSWCKQPCGAVSCLSAGE